MIWNEKIECISREELRALQSERLIELVKKVYNNVPFYRQKMDEMGINPSHIRSIDDITKLPFTYKTDLRDNYPFGLFAASMKEIVRALDYKYDSGQVSVSINYWVKRGEISAQIKEGYKRNKVYALR